MPDLKKRIIDILEKPQLASFATITKDGKPWVRYVMCMGSADLSIRFASHIYARKVEQIKNNPEVHLTCGIQAPRVMNPYLQIQGRAMLTTDTAERNNFWSDNLKNIFKGPDDPQYGVIILTPYRIELCNPREHEPEVLEIN